MTTPKPEFPLAEASAVAEDICQILRPYCHRVEIAGSIRRQRPTVHDIDIVAEPRTCCSIVGIMGGKVIPPKREKLSTICRFTRVRIPVDLYLVWDPSAWATILLIRTGSAEHNIWLCRKANALGRKLCADGQGVIVRDTGSRIAGDTEESIYAALGFPYLPPEARENPT